MPSATCVNGHQASLGDGAVPTDVGAVKWECPECGAVGVVDGTAPLPAPAPSTTADVAVNGSDVGTATSPTP